MTNQNSFHYREPKKIYRLFLGGNLHGVSVLLDDYLTEHAHQAPEPMPEIIQADPYPVDNAVSLSLEHYSLVKFKTAGEIVHAFVLAGTDPLQAYRDHKALSLKRAEVDTFAFLDGRPLNVHIWHDLNGWAKSQGYEGDEYRLVRKIADVVMSEAITDGIRVLGPGKAELIYQTVLRRKAFDPWPT